MWLLRHHMQGEGGNAVLQLDADVFEKMDTDQIKALIRQRNHARPLDEVLSELEATHAQVVATLAVMPFDKLRQPRYADDAEQRPLLLWIAGNTYEHYQEHYAMLQS